jgi:sugar phosphate isomerase/epimerase
MKISLCNEVLEPLTLSKQFDYAAAIGYDGIELAPYTLGEKPELLSKYQRQAIKKQAEDAGAPITSFHFLLARRENLSITSMNKDIRDKTINTLCELIILASDLGARSIVHGSHHQRSIDQNCKYEDAWKAAKEVFIKVSEVALEHRINYCLEPLALSETNFINTLEEASSMVSEVNNQAFCSMIDCSAAIKTESKSIPSMIEEGIRSELVRHIQLNDKNLGGPGQGCDQFTKILTTLVEYQFKGVISVEPFEYHPDGPSAAARSIGYIRGILEAINHQ